jgi:pimeloyl-ACP methyl ester carboxylesterase
VTNSNVTTSHGRISVADTGGPGAAVLCIHGNSACKEIFAQQFESRLAHRYRMIAFDLPGHGASADADNPQRTYCIPGYADVALELLEELDVEQVAILGWSLGGHVGIELLSRDIDVAGLVITGTPPIGHNAADFAAGFRPQEHMDLTGKESFSEADIQAYASGTAGSPAPFLEAAVRRTDGRARRLMMEGAMAARGADQREVASTSPVPLAVITGADEPFINNDYLRTFPYRNLWDRKVHVIAETGHAPFWERPQTFNPLFERFLTDVLS